MMSSIIKETRTQVIWRYLHRLVNTKAVKWQTIAETVRDIYHVHVPEEIRRVEFSTQKDVHARSRLDAQTLRRFEHDTKWAIPDDLTESVILAVRMLDIDLADDMEAELAARIDRLNARVPDEHREGVAGDMGTLSMKIGGLYKALAPAIADGVFDEKDLPHACTILREIADLEGALLTMRKQVNGILPEPNKEGV